MTELNPRLIRDLSEVLEAAKADTLGDRSVVSRLLDPANFNLAVQLKANWKEIATSTVLVVGMAIDPLATVMSLGAINATFYYMRGCLSALDTLGHH